MAGTYQQLAARVCSGAGFALEQEPLPGNLGGSARRIYFNFPRQRYYRRHSFEHYMPFAIDASEHRRNPNPTSLWPTGSGSREEVLTVVSPPEISPEIQIRNV